MGAYIWNLSIPRARWDVEMGGFREAHRSAWLARASSNKETASHRMEGEARHLRSSSDFMGSGRQIAHRVGQSVKGTQGNEALCLGQNRHSSLH